MLTDDAPLALVVDDDPLIRLDACDILERAGFCPMEAADVDEAIGILERDWESVRLLFTDIQLGDGRDGMCLARETANRWPDVGILVASGNIKPKPGELPNGAVFIGKPFSARLVEERIAELLPDGQRPEPLAHKTSAT